MSAVALLPGAQVPVLVVSALVAAAACGVGVSRSRGVDRSAWLLLGAASVLNGMGNLAFASGVPDWVAVGSWPVDTTFTLAVLASVAGLFTLVAPDGALGERWREWLDLLIVIGASFAVGWHLGVPRAIGLSVEPSAVDLIRFLSVLVGLIGVVVGVLAWGSRARGQQVAVRLAAGSVTVAVVGDLIPLIGPDGLDERFSTGAWVLSSCLLTVGALFVPERPRRVLAFARSRSIDLATLTVGCSLLALVGGGAADAITEVIVVVVVLLLLVRQMRMLHMNLDLARALRESEGHFRALVDDTTDVIMRVSPDARISYASRASLPVLGRAGTELIGSSITDLVEREDRARLLGWLGSGKDPLGRFEAEITPKGARPRVVSFVGSPTSTDVVLSIREVTRQVELRRQLEAAARWDALTGLANRATFDAILEKRIEAGLSAAVLFCDLDHFKRINDTSGHAAGDAVLVEVSRRMADAIGDDDLLARFGGDEFTVLLRPGIDGDEARRLARRIQESVQGSYRVAADHGPGIGLSITAGLAFGGSGRDAEEVMRNADLALYAAKADARGSLRVFEQSMYDDFAKRVELEQRLREALDADGLTLAYQPLLDLQSGAVVGVEALLRWFDDGEVVLGPPELIELAESFDSDGQVARWVLRAAVAQAASWSAASYPVRMSINVSTRQLHDATLVDVLGDLLDHHSLDPALITLEITEGAYLDDSSGAIDNLHRLRQLGVGLAIDDFGTGYSSLAYLTRLPVDELKVDRAFVAGIPQDKDRTALVRTVIRMANDLGLRVTSEGVERMEQLRMLRDMGAHLAQGYLITRPVPADELLALLKRGPYVVEVADGETVLQHAATDLGQPIVD